MNKFPLNLHIDVNSFLPATDKDKEYILEMRPPSTFFKDGIRRLAKNKIALVSLIIIVLITLFSILVPIFWPYSYDSQLGITPGKPVDSSYANLSPLNTAPLRKRKFKQVRGYFLTFSVLTNRGVTILYASFTAQEFLLQSVSSQALSYLLSDLQSVQSQVTLAVKSTLL